jgi:SPP1 gp7 family putative phage head morphogenesis protein
VASANDDIHDALLRRQVYLDKYTQGAQRTIASILNDSEPDLRAVIERRLAGLVASDGGAAIDSEEALARLARAVASVRGDAIDSSFDDLTADLQKLGPHEAQYMDDTFKKYSPVQLDTVMPASNVLASIVLAEPMQGKLMSQWAEKLKALDVERVMDTVRAGMAEGLTTDSIVRNVLGSGAVNGADGAIELTRANASAIAQTAISTVANEARAAYTEANSDIVGEEVWVATLDDATCIECGSLDGQTFKAGEGEQPPAHYNCRCVRVPTLDGELIGDRPATTATEDNLDGLSDEERAAKVIELTGQVPASLTYEEWLGRQSAEFQDEVLGANRAELFRSGDLELSQFIGRDGDLLTLDELASKSGLSGLAETEAPGVHAFGPVASRAMVDDWLAQANFESVADLTANVAANDALLKEVGDAVAAKTDAFFKKGAIKTTSRIEEKIARGKLPGQITDVVRASFYTDNPEQVDAVIQGLAKKFPLVDENWRVTEGGYFDRTLKVRFPDGMVGEVQIGPPQLFAAKKAAGHDIYKQWQAAKRDLGADSEKALGLIQDMQKVYGDARATLPPDWLDVLKRELNL